MADWAAILRAVVSLILLYHPTAVSTSDRHGAANCVLGISATCSAQSMNVTVRMRYPFRGLLYAHGFPLECSTAREQHHKLFDFLKKRERERLERERGGGGGDDAVLSNQVPLQASREVTLSLPASECGIRVVPSKDGEGLWLQTTVVVQLDRHLQQAADQTRSVSCFMNAKESSVLLQPLQSHRTGRQHSDDIPSVDFGDGSSSASSPASSSSPSSPSTASSLPQHWQRARAVMEILSTAGRAGGRAGPRDTGVLAVGEEAALIVTSHLPAGVGSRVTDCFAHDGAGESMERLSDGRGCPTDRLILPQLRDVQDAAQQQQQHRKRRKRALTTHVTAAKFAAFKFPDRSRLHLRCQLQLCRDACPQDSCLPERSNFTRQERKARKGERGEVLGRLQVFNSVEVLAPGIEAEDRLRLDELTAASGGGTSPSPSSSAGRDQQGTLCMSPPRMALALATLGSVLVCGVAAALYSLCARPGDAPLRAFLRRHLLAHGSAASLVQERNALVRASDSPSPMPPPPPAPGLGLWHGKHYGPPY